MRYSACEALKSVASFSSCLPSWPDIACHQWISVTACAGDVKPNAAAQTADASDFRTELTIESFRRIISRMAITRGFLSGAPDYVRTPLVAIGKRRARCTINAIN